MIGEFPAKLSKFCLDTPHSGDQEWSPSRGATRDVGGRAVIPDRRVASRKKTCTIRHASAAPLHRIPYSLLLHDEGRQRRSWHRAIGYEGRLLSRLR